MYTISLENLEFYAYHGYYQEENLIGTNFIVDIHVKIDDMQLNEGDLTQCFGVSFFLLALFGG